MMMSSAAMSMNAWREAGIRMFGYEACAAKFREPPAAHELVRVRDLRVARPVTAVQAFTEPEPAPEPVQREMRIMALVEPPEGASLPRAKGRRLRRAIEQHPALLARECRVLADGLLPRCRDALTCYPAHERIARDAGVGKSTVARALKGLREKGAITIQHRGRAGRGPGRTSNLYGIQLAFFFGEGGNQISSGEGVSISTGPDESMPACTQARGGRWQPNHEPGSISQPLTVAQTTDARARADKPKSTATPVRQAATVPTPTSVPVRAPEPTPGADKAKSTATPVRQEATATAPACQSCGRSMRSFGPLWVCLPCGERQDKPRSRPSLSVDTDMHDVDGEKLAHPMCELFHRYL